MSYPQRGATYSHKPKFIDRMKRAEGGSVKGEGHVDDDWEEPLKHAAGGKVHLTAGSESGEGRLQKSEARARHAKSEKPQRV